MVNIPRIIFLSMTKSLGKRAFSDSLLAPMCNIVSPSLGMAIVAKTRAVGCLV